MFLTLYYIAATWIQSWRLRSVSAKLSKHINEKMSVVFFNVQEEPGSLPATLLSSELCTNYNQARIADILWHQGYQRGAAILPKQNLNLGPWISFPATPNLIPFDFNASNIQINDDASLHILLETDLVPAKDNYMLLVEHFGQPVAWKVDSHLAVLIKSDLHHLTELILTSFMHESLSVNDGLPLVRIESVSIDGEPQPFDSIRNHSRKDIINRSMRLLSPSQWDKHIVGLRSFGILASQAFEFEYNKNRTEGKTGIVKPDLIPTKPFENATDSKDSAESSPSKIIKKPSPKVSPKASPLKLIPEIDFSGKFEESSNDLLATGETVKQNNETDKIQNDVAKESISDMSKVKENISNSVKSSENIDIPFNNVNTSFKNNASSKPTISTRENGAMRPSLVRSKGSIISSKPPNILVYSDSILTRDNVISTLNAILEVDMYTIYPLTTQQVHSRAWINSTSLLVVCGYVSQDIGPILTEYFLSGGKMLSLCSDILHIILPSFRTHAEIREHELVQFSYGRWQNVKMMHHIFCYQPSPVRKHFSTDSDEPQIVQKKPTLVCPRSVEVIDLQDNKHSLHVQVLGTEETWNTPSLILASSDASGGKAIFSQIHLEADPNLYEHDEIKYSILKNSDRARIEIFTDILSSHLGMVVMTPMGNKNPVPSYTSAFFLGDHKFKFELLEKLKSQMTEDNTLKTPKITLKFCNRGEQPPMATSTLLPILVNACPDHFSTIDYFDNLKSITIGRLVIFAPVIGSSMDIIQHTVYDHGLVVIPHRQLNGSGRSGNKWLSPDGCTMFSIQLHIPIASTLGQRVSLIQLVIGVAMINALRSIKGYENLDIRLKWPNDIYANGRIKIGGILVTCTIESTMAICNLGCAINLNNSTPTTCISDLVKEYNLHHNDTLPMVGYEKYLALVFTEFELIYNRIQNGDLKYFYDLYQQLWLHSNEQVTVLDTNGQGKLCEILGIDDFGYLLIKSDDQSSPISVHPDGNSFDMLQGLIISK